MCGGVGLGGSGSRNKRRRCAGKAVGGKHRVLLVACYFVRMINVEERPVTQEEKRRRGEERRKGTFLQKRKKTGEQYALLLLIQKQCVHIDTDMFDPFWDQILKDRWSCSF